MVEPDFDAITDMSQLPEEAFTPRRYQPGDTLEGEIVSIDDEGLVVSVGLKTEGMVPIAEMRTLAPEERAGLKLGDRMQFTVLQGERGSEMAMLSLDRARQAQMWDNLQQSLSSGDVVTAKITGHNTWYILTGQPHQELGFIAEDKKQEDIIRKRKHANCWPTVRGGHN